MLASYRKALDAEIDTGYSHENSHIFDGEAVHRNVGYYQLCDMTDPFLQEVIQNDEFVREECDVSLVTPDLARAGRAGLTPKFWLYRSAMDGGMVYT